MSVATIVAGLKKDFEKGEADLRKIAPEVLDALGVNTADEHQIFHAVLAYLLKVLSETAEAEIEKGGL